MKSKKLRVFSDRQALAEALAEEWQEKLRQADEAGEKVYLALSGGSTPEVLFRHLAAPPYRNAISWKALHLFWGDERCLPPNHPQSNYGMTRETLLRHVALPAAQIHRIRGEDPPVVEARRYAAEISRQLPKRLDQQPRFDWIFLGMGTDGHTASLFPGAATLEEKEKICLVAEHPESGQKRISLTLPVINAARRITFLVTGSDKAEMLRRILRREAGFERYPAARVQPRKGVLEWCLDAAAAAEVRDLIK